MTGLTRVILLLAFGFANAAQAAPRKLLSIDVQILEASNRPLPRGAVASRAARDLSSTFNFKSFRAAGEHHETLTIGEQMVFTLSNGAQVTLTAVSVGPGKAGVRLRARIVDRGQKLETDYSVREGGTVFVSAGRSGPDAVLVLAIIPTLSKS